MELGGTRKAAAMLSRMRSEKAQDLLQQLRNENPQLAEAIEEHLFSFHHLERLSARSLQILLRETTEEDWTVALADASVTLVQQVLENLSKRSSERLRAAIRERPRYHRHDVELAQGRIVQQARTLADRGTIQLFDSE